MRAVCASCDGAGCSSSRVLRRELDQLTAAMVLADEADFAEVGSLLDRITACPADAWIAMFSVAADLHLSQCAPALAPTN